MEENLTPYQQWKKNLGTTRPWDLLNPKTEYVDEEEASRRMDICKGCPLEANCKSSQKALTSSYVTGSLKTGADESL